MALKNLAVVLDVLYDTFGGALGGTWHFALDAVLMVLLVIARLASGSREGDGRRG